MAVVAEAVVKMVEEVAELVAMVVVLMVNRGQPQRLLVEQPTPEVVVVEQEVLVMAGMADQELL